MLDSRLERSSREVHIPVGPIHAFSYGLSTIVPKKHCLGPQKGPKKTAKMENCALSQWNRWVATDIHLDHLYRTVVLINTNCGVISVVAFSVMLKLKSTFCSINSGMHFVVCLCHKMVHWSSSFLI
jgi:hypothetical protein